LGCFFDRIGAGIGIFKLFEQNNQKILDDDLVFIENNTKPTPKGKFLTDGIASDLFYLNLEE
jgi:oxygen-independent coproporphyrinogen-3 oxidase